jgi:predicted transcriptional regulator
MKKRVETHWTDRMDRAIRDEWANLSLVLLAERFGCSPESVARRAAFLGLPGKRTVGRTKARVDVKGGGKTFTIQQSIGRLFGRKA